MPGSAAKLILALVMFLSMACAQATPEVFLNKRGMTRDGQWLFTVGGRNQLELRGVAAGSAVKVAVLAPSGLRFEIGAQETAPGMFTAELGPMLAGLRFVYEEGIVLAAGYGLEISIERDGASSVVSRLQQVPGKRFVDWKYGDTIANTTGHLEKDAPPLYRFNPARSVGVVVDFYLNEGVLLNNREVSLRAGLRPNASMEAMDGRLVVRDANGREVQSRDVKLSRGETVEIAAFDTREWARGDYQFQLEPIVGKQTFPDGPSLTYRRDPDQDGGVWISPVLPWRLPSRINAPSLEISRFPNDKAVLPSGWQASEGGAAALDGRTPLIIQPNLKGLYAVYVTPLDRGCLISVGSDKTVRASKLDTEQFVTVADLTDREVRVYGFDWIEKSGRKSGLRSIRFEPVTPAALETLSRMGQPPLHLTGIDDWMEYFHGAARLQADQIHSILRGQQEVGLGTVAWSVGRSLVEYHSELPEATRFPARALAGLQAQHPAVHAYKSREAMINLLCPFRTALHDSSEIGLQLSAWLGMNRHYGADVMDGVFASRWFSAHQDWRQWRKNADTPNRGEVCYYFPGVRAERLSILNELISIGANSLTLDTTRQIPMLLYNPQMVEAYVKEFGRDPRTFGSENQEGYAHWIQWRSGFFTELLRDLRRSTAKAGRKIEICLRVPQLDLTHNLAMGLDIRTWLQEGLIDQLLLNPLETCQGEGLARIAEYQPLCRQHSVKLSVGVGATWMSRIGLAPALRRAAGVQAAAVERLDLYEAEYLAFLTESRWVPAVMGSPELMKQFQGSSNFEACYPILPETACYGLDNHARWLKSGWTLEGTAVNSL